MLNEYPDVLTVQDIQKIFASERTARTILSRQRPYHPYASAALTGSARML